MLSADKRRGGLTSGSIVQSHYQRRTHTTHIGTILNHAPYNGEVALQLNR